MLVEKINRFMGGAWQRAKSVSAKRNQPLYQSHVQAINLYWRTLKNKSDYDLHQQAWRLKEKGRLAESIDQFLIEAFSLASEVTWRLLKLRPFDEQIRGHRASSRQPSRDADQ